MLPGHYLDLSQRNGAVTPGLAFVVYLRVITVTADECFGARLVSPRW